jgi:CspA family cold shock protein
VAATATPPSAAPEEGSASSSGAYVASWLSDPPPVELCAYAGVVGPQRTLVPGRVGALEDPVLPGERRPKISALFTYRLVMLVPPTEKALRGLASRSKGASGSRLGQLPFRLLGAPALGPKCTGAAHDGRPGLVAVGVVKWFNSEKGYRFISQQTGPDVFVHYSAIQGGGDLTENDKVEFDVTQGPKGPQAGNVRRIS